MEHAYLLSLESDLYTIITLADACMNICIYKDQQSCIVNISRYFENNSCLPIFHKGRKKYSSEQIITTLFNSKVEDCDRVCTAQPYGCEENCSFIVDLSKLNDSSDIKSDDLGSWKNMGVHCVYASVGFDNNDCVQRVNVLGNRKPKVMRSTIYKLKKTYWRHKVANDFSRKMFELLGQ